MKCKCCGNDRFYADQELWASVIVDEDGCFIENSEKTLEKSIYDAVTHGPYVCTECGASYDWLDEDDGREE